MKHKLHVAFANREDLLRDAVKSALPIGNIHVWADGVPSPTDIEGVTHHSLPPVPATSVINFMIKESWDDDVMFWMHNDGYARDGVAEKFLEFVKVKQASDEKWGVIFTNYDVLCAFNMKAVRECGYWDTMYYQYAADDDYYHNLLSHDYKIIEYGEEGVLHRNHEAGIVGHGGSNTILADPLYNHRVQWRARTKFDEAYFQMKWGTAKQGYRKILNARAGYKRPFQNFNPTAPTTDRFGSIARSYHMKSSGLKA